MAKHGGARGRRGPAAAGGIVVVPMLAVLLAAGCGAARAGGGGGHGDAGDGGRQDPMALTGAVPPLPFGVRDEPVDRTYDVEGLTTRELARSMRARGPISGNQRVFGQHDYHVSWRFRYAPGMMGCRMQDVRVELSSVITLPRWVDRDRADPALAAAWDEFLAALAAHEHGHRVLAYHAAAEVQRRLRRVTRPSCPGIDQDANAIGREVLEQYRQLNREYDAETRGGGTQGVAWPPR